MYYLRTRPKADAIQFTVDKAQLKGTLAASQAAAAADEEEEECLTCSA